MTRGAWSPYAGCRMVLALYDTLAAREIPFVPSEPGHAKIYVCGPTTYDDAHIGHARPCITYDVLVRYLRSTGMEVTYVRNVTDIDDKIIKRAAENGETPKALSDRMFVSYTEDMDRLGNIRPDREPRVSETMDEIVSLIEQLIARGHAYQAGGDVYFEVSTFASYGKLSHRKLTDMEAGASERVDEAELGKKRHPFDFALWKGAKEGEPSWPSPWGQGRPGWHIECSAMSMKELGTTIDLHGGGLDLVFPHHENEIAQSECATGQCYSRHWMHNGFVQVNKEKMSKSVGNFFRLREAFARVEPEAIRYSLLSVHYRTPYNLEVDLDDAGNLLSFPQFREAESRLAYLYETRARLVELDPSRIDDGAQEGAGPDIFEFRTRMNGALESDLNTALALAHAATLLKATNELLDRTKQKKTKISRLAHTQAGEALASLGAVLGIGLEAPRAFIERVRDRKAEEAGVEREWVESRLRARHTARQEKDFAAADQVRAELSARGVEILDSPQGTTWRLS